MKNGIKEIVGKQIVSVVVAQSTDQSRDQVFLVFSDGTRFEFLGESFTCGDGLVPAAGIEEFVESCAGRIERVYGDVRHLAPPRKAKVLATQDDGSLEKVLKRDLQAWRQVKEAIDKARARH